MIIRAAIFAAVTALSGCSSAGSSYAKSHPELSPAHRRILINGKIPGGAAVEGMTREQVTLAVGNPAATEKYETEEAWIYFGSGQSETSAFNTYSSPSTSRSDTERNFTETESFAASQKLTKTIVYFRGDRAVRAQITEGKP